MRKSSRKSPGRKRRRSSQRAPRTTRGCPGASLGLTLSILPLGPIAHTARPRHWPNVGTQPPPVRNRATKRLEHNCRNCRFAGDGADVRGLPSRYSIGARVPLGLRDSAELRGLTLPARSQDEPTGNDCRPPRSTRGTCSFTNERCRRVPRVAPAEPRQFDRLTKMARIVSWILVTSRARG